MLRTVQLSIVLALCCSTTVAAAVRAPARGSSSSSSLSKQGPSGICACIANTYDSRDCTSAVAAYCNGHKTANAGFCRGMLNVGQLKTNKTAASVLVGFLATVCKPAHGAVMDKCACFSAPNSDACASARLKLCAHGDALCPAITLGLSATPNQAAYGRVYNQKTCQSNSPLEIEMEFPGIDQQTFNTKYAAKTAAALANITGVNTDQIAYNKTLAAPLIRDKQTDTSAANATAAEDSTVASASASAAAAAQDAAKQAAAKQEAAATAPKGAAAKNAAAEARQQAGKQAAAQAKAAAAEKAAAQAAAAAAKKAEKVVPAEPAPASAPKASALEAATAEATAKSKDFDSWSSAPACSYPRTAKNANLDRLGRPWGYNSATGDSCAFKSATAPAQPKYEDAPVCSYKLTANNALPDKLGRLWGYDDATGASCVFRKAAPPAAASAGRGSRRMLLQAPLPHAAVTDTAVMKYSVAAADAGRARRRFMNAVQHDGQLLYSALEEEGVPMKPAVSLSGEQLLAGELHPSAKLLPRSGALSYYDAAALGVASPQEVAAGAPVKSQTALPEPAMIGIIVSSAVGGSTLVGLVVWRCCRGHKRRTAAERLKEQETAMDVKPTTAKDADTYAVVRD